MTWLKLIPSPELTSFEDSRPFAVDPRGFDVRWTGAEQWLKAHSIVPGAYKGTGVFLSEGIRRTLRITPVPFSLLRTTPVAFSLLDAHSRRAQENGHGPGEPLRPWRVRFWKDCVSLPCPGIAGSGRASKRNWVRGSDPSTVIDRRSHACLVLPFRP